MRPLADTLEVLRLAPWLWRIRRDGSRGPEARARLRRRRLAALVADVRRRSPAYARRWKGLPERVEDPAVLPPVTKEEMVAELGDWLTDPAIRPEALAEFTADPANVGRPFLGRYLVSRTSGSTGGSALVVHDPSEIRLMAALWAVRGWRVWMRADPAARRLRRTGRRARVITFGDHYTGAAFSEWLGRYARGRRSTTGINILDPLPEVVAALDEVRPDFLGTYPTMLHVLARERAAGRLAIDPVLATVSGECLDPGVREEAEAAFGCPVRNVYAATEHFALAFDCPEGRLHLNDDQAILEPVDDDLRPVPPGTVSSGALVTNFANRVQPFVRFLLTDEVRIDPDPCPCGSGLPVVEVLARRRQALALPGRDGGAVQVLPGALSPVVQAVRSVDRFQLWQTEPGVLRLRLKVMEGADAEATWRAVEEGLDAFLERQGADVRVERDSIPPRRDPRTGKFMKVWSEVGG